MANNMFDELDILDLEDLLDAEDTEAPAEDTFDQVAAENSAAKNKPTGNVSDESAPDKGPSDKVLSDKGSSDKDPSDKVLSDKEPSDKRPSDKRPSDMSSTKEGNSDRGDAGAIAPFRNASDEDQLIIEEVPLDAPPRKKTTTSRQTAPAGQAASARKAPSSRPAAAPRKAVSDQRIAPSRKAASSRHDAPTHRMPRPQASSSGQSFQPQDPDEKQPFPLHLALLAAIVVVIIVAIVRFVVWSQGKELTVHSGQNSSKYIIEVNDNMVYLSDSKLEGHSDDGVTTVLCLGDEPFSQDTSSSGLAGQIAALGNCNVINAAFPGSQVTCENAQYSVDSLDSMDDIFNLFYVSYAISIGDFSSLETVASAHTEDSTYQQSVDALKNTDFSAVDIIAIMYDGSDYINGMAMQNPDVPDELTTYVGSLTNSIQLLQNAYPYIRIVFLSPYYSEYDGASGRTTDIGNGTLVNYFQWAYDTCGSCSVSFLDNYYGSVNENNYTEYLSDGIHLNAAGCTKVADHFVYKVLQDNYAEYDVSSMAVASGGN